MQSGEQRSQAAFSVSSSLLTQLDFIPFNSRYEDEINKRTAAENEFVKLKKVRWVRSGVHAPFLKERILRKESSRRLK